MHPFSDPPTSSKQHGPRALLRLSFPLLALALTPFAPAQTLSAAALARRVDDHYNHLKSFQARYTERYQGMGTDRTEAGTLLLKKPGRMRWSYDTPAGKVFILDGHDAVSYTPGDAEANRIPAKQLDDLRSPLQLLLGHTELARELDHLDAAPVGDGYSLTGTPKGMANRIRYVALTVTPDGTIHGLTLEETSGARTTFTFTFIRENVPAPDSDFIFTPPPGVAVVNGNSPL